MKKCGHCDGLGLVQAESRELDKIDPVVADLVGLSIVKKVCKVTFVGHRGFAPNGSTIYYIATDASIKKVADALGVTFVNKTGAALLSGGSSDLYVFTNGIKGTGPMGYQVSIAAANVGDIAYSPLWRIQATTWKDPLHAEFLTSLAQITSAAQAGKLSTNIDKNIISLFHHVFLLLSFLDLPK